MPKRTNHLQAYYDKLNDYDKKRFRDAVTVELEISENSLWRKMRTFKWKKSEKKIIAKAARKPFTELFPELVN